LNSQINNVQIDLAVVLGRTTFPMHQLLRMGRGAVIPLNCGQDDEVWVLANNHPIARGEISIDGEKMTIIITGPADVNDFKAGI
jgi:flagellar motor switch protein FliN/FliY